VHPLSSQPNYCTACVARRQAVSRQGKSRERNYAPLPRLLRREAPRLTATCSSSRRARGTSCSCSLARFSPPQNVYRPRISTSITMSVAEKCLDIEMKVAGRPRSPRDDDSGRERTSMALTATFSRSSPIVRWHLPTSSWRAVDTPNRIRSDALTRFGHDRIHRSLGQAIVSENSMDDARCHQGCHPGWPNLAGRHNRSCCNVPACALITGRAGRLPAGVSGGTL